MNTPENYKKVEEVQIVLVQSTFDLITSQDNIKRFKPNASIQRKRKAIRNKETKIQEKNQVDRATYANTKNKEIYENREA